MTDTQIDDVAVEVVAFAKSHEWPKENSPEFFEFAKKITMLELAIRKKYPGAFNKLRGGEG